jgi:hypothetical protein
VLETILDEYHVETDRSEGDLFALLQDLATKNLIVIDARANGAINLDLVRLFVSGQFAPARPERAIRHLLTPEFVEAVCQRCQGKSA